MPFVNTRSVCIVWVTLLSALYGLGADASRDRQEEDIREVIVRWEIKQDPFREKLGTIFFLSFGEHGSDPSNEFMQRFSNEAPAVRRRSDSTKRMRREAVDKKRAVKVLELVDKKTGHPGRMIIVSAIRWKSEDEIEADGGWWEGLLAARWNVYTLRKVDGKWQVTKANTKRIS